MVKVSKFMVLFMMIFMIVFSCFGTVNANGIDKLDVGDDYKIIGIDDAGESNGGSRILAEYRNVIVGVSGVATLTFVILFIVNFMKLGKSAGNPQERSNSIMGIIITGIAAAGCGGVMLFVSFFYNLL